MIRAFRKEQLRARNERMSILGNKMRRREKANGCADDSEGAEDDETEAVDDDGGKLPLANDVT